MMTLKRFRVTNFRSIMDSGWIGCDDVTSLVGVNEAGKSNVILALWKLNPVRDGKIDALHDMPTKKYAAWRSMPEKITFVSADFELDSTLADKVVKLCDCDKEAASIVNIFLVFLVESQEAHKGAILLLDEAGLSLHPLAQKDLIAFFDNLAKTNQMIYTTHSPFLVDPSNIDRAKVVYSDTEGHTVVSSDLRASDDKLNEKSIYAVHAALGLSVSDIILQVCKPVIVEGPSDQNYLNAIKLFLIHNQKFAPSMEIVFIPSGGVRGIPGVVSIVSGKNETLPLVILDSDQSGKDAKKKLLSGLYKDSHERVIEIADFSDVPNCEFEDIVPIDLMRRQLDRLFRDVEDEDVFDSLLEGQPVIPQIEEFARKHRIELNKGWKVDLSRNVKQQLHKAKSVPDTPEYKTECGSFRFEFYIFDFKVDSENPSKYFLDGNDKKIIRGHRLERAGQAPRFPRHHHEQGYHGGADRTG